MVEYNSYRFNYSCDLGDLMQPQKSIFSVKTIENIRTSIEQVLVVSDWTLGQAKKLTGNGIDWANPKTIVQKMQSTQSQSMAHELREVFRGYKETGKLLVQISQAIEDAKHDEDDSAPPALVTLEVWDQPFTDPNSLDEEIFSHPPELEPLVKTRHSCRVLRRLIDRIYTLPSKESPQPSA